MKNKLLESIPCEGLKYGTHIDVEVFYSKYRSPRGYYIRVMPVKREGIMVSSDLLSGISQLLLETGRYTDKEFERAVEMGRAAAPELIERMIEKNKAA